MWAGAGGFGLWSGSGEQWPGQGRDIIFDFIMEFLVRWLEPEA